MSQQHFDCETSSSERPKPYQILTPIQRNRLQNTNRLLKQLGLSTRSQSVKQENFPYQNDTNNFHTAFLQSLITLTDPKKCTISQTYLLLAIAFIAVALIYRTQP